MRRAERLFEIIQILRRERAPVTAAAIAGELEVTKRTIYRDIAHLQARRVPIEGAAGVGYLLRSGFDLPPLMFTDDEIEAVLIGLRVVESWADPGLAHAASDVLAKVAAVLPPDLRPRIDTLSLLAPPNDLRKPAVAVDLEGLRHCIRERRKVWVEYTDGKGDRTARTLWPLAFAFFPPVWLLLAWCELRQDFRAFRPDRMARADLLLETYPNTPGRRLTDFLARDRAACGTSGEAA